MGMMKFAVTPGFEVGGTIFKPEQLALLGSIIGENAKIELTNFKQLYVEMEVERLEEVKRKLSETGLEIYPVGFVTKSLIPCNFCRGAEDAGLEIAQKLNRMIAGISTPSPLKIGYAGCALGTSEPLLKDIGVVKMRDKFDMYIGGEPKSLKPAFAELFVTGVDAEQMMDIVQRLITYFQNNGKNKEKFSKFIGRISIEKLRNTVAS
ncbi:nitrite reductase [Paenibacillus chondroitinus]|uniref:Nitrite reductase n=1 Tax=Paenibacillus chondroitinus TaxID=59842 RepID=A0ABU6DLP1_9BACL|nr:MULTISPECIES: nitrite reductase [Paenibacillus]MCY9657138.1 nitrite reductase [Paenibacillus anseongense]MEB4798421.1 nitrite reductase [Paenibacillus chondroitinus]